ncbi:MAG TPA: energy transducer TonB [Blastocatellia bacterium]|nr:energy transducer TonB [Blastocatellia bacterium]
MMMGNSATERVCLFALLAGLLCIAALTQARDGRHGQEVPEKIYEVSEVDTKAEVRKPYEHPGNNCNYQETGCSSRGYVKLQIVLHKKRKVTEVKVIVGDKCKPFVENAVSAAKRINFTPAIKDGVEVSQYLTIEYSYRCGL